MLQGWKVSPYSSDQDQENIVHLLILCSFWHYKVKVFASLCTLTVNQIK